MQEGVKIHAFYGLPEGTSMDRSTRRVEHGSTLSRALAVLLLVASSARGATPTVPDPLAWPWGADIQRVQQDYPPEPGSPLKNYYRGKLVLMGESLESASVAFNFRADQGLQSVRVSLPPDSWRRLLQTFERKYGKPRYANTREHLLFTHYMEWSTSTFGAVASITTVGEDPKGEVWRNEDGDIQFQRGPVTASVVDAIAQWRTEMQTLQLKMQQDASKQAQAAKEAERQRATTASQPPPPAESDALRWAREASERLRSADCATPYERGFESFHRIFMAPGDRAARALLDAGFNARDLYYDGGFPGRCARQNNIASPLIVNAVRAGNAAATALLAQRGADVEYISVPSMCLIEEAAWRSTTEVLRALLAAGARCTGKPNGTRALVNEVVWRQPVEKLQVLLDFKYTLDTDNLRTLAYGNDLPKVRLAVRQGYKWTGEAAKHAALYSSPDVLEEMVRGGTDPTELLRTVVTPSYSFGSEPNDSKRTERARRLLTVGAQVAANGVLYPEVAGALAQSPAPMRELLSSAAERTLPGSSERARAAFRTQQAPQYVVDLSDCGSALHVVSAHGGKPPRPGQSIEWGSVDVTVTAQGKPVTMLLLAYGPTRWRLHTRAGVRLDRVILVGYHTQMLEAEQTVRQIRRTYDDDRFGWNFSEDSGLSDVSFAQKVSSRFGTEPASIQKVTDSPFMTVDGSHGARPPFTCTSSAALAPAAAAGPDKYDRMVEEAERRGRMGK